MTAWYALRTVPMREFAVAQILSTYNLRAFCPTEVKWRRISRRKRQPVAYAMLPRYLFAACADPWTDILRQPWSRNIQGVVSIEGRPAVIPEAAIARLAKLSGAAIPSSTAPVHRGFVPGEVVRVARGSLLGKLVELAEIKGRSGVILTRMLGSERMPVEISLDDLEAA